MPRSLSRARGRGSIHGSLITIGRHFGSSFRTKPYGGNFRAGLLGIGGGMIVSPLLLELGLHPQVAAATSSLMVLFSASSAALSFAFDHLLNIEYALIYGIGALLPRSGLKI